MKRIDFIKTTALATAGLPLLSSFKLKMEQEGIPKALLMGYNNDRLVGDGFQLERTTMQAFQDLKQAAVADGITIEVASAFRSYDRQLAIWSGKYKRFTQSGLTPIAAMEKIIEYSTIPGTSRHHWGTDMDLIDGGASPRPSSVLEAKHFHGKGPFCKFKEWMNAHAESYGFHEVYTNNAQRKGFKYEPWHFSYKPVSQKYLEAYLKLDIKSELERLEIPGAEHMNLQFIEKYLQDNIADINPDLLPAR
ncbi:M15 family metallopeptidase [Gilvibacter sediminis]|uniref:M15 family metallopeptidase n=1 Tax=Gilvibacter sediminis TaxID=379071 RepID=UPI0023503BAD|nr:M15 family metallopeptidase [Gilvibacter sediminis]MDC7998568.1 M15 family metallopeptidase [Gilvibacter sediminis]